MLINMDSRSIGPSTCGVFLSQVEVFLEDELGRRAKDLICRRGTSRFGQVNFWLDGRPAAAGTQTSLEKADMFILVGYPPELWL
ncbi:MAG: hypothetical protein QHH02_02660, partial [Syntrophomonadaceae bacterium]|nr:hypothetical protein [Syntrophomonadaceae bacterium]